MRFPRMAAFLLSAAAFGCGGGHSDDAANASPSGEFVLVGVHPGAAQQSTAQGRTLAALQPFGPLLYFGYGDYTANTGPIQIIPYDPAQDAFLASAGASDTEAIFGFREIGGELWAPAIDPKVSADFAVIGADGSWEDRDVVVSTHVFDAAQLGSDIFLVGSLGKYAVVWKSADGGETFQFSMSLLPASGVTDDFARFYFAGVHGGKLHVQAVDYFGGPQPGSRVFDGTGWSNGPDLLPLGGAGWHPVGFAGRMVYLTLGAGHGPSRLLAFDGAQAGAVVSWSVYDIAVSGARLYALAVDGRVMRTEDLVSWEEIASAPSGSRSIAVQAGMLHVGATEARLFRFTQPVD
ncbi:MAG: hypothetical protein HYY17_08310 [Planctomycetes bacterium]|nr:hypothetical protein [Planctomycetota bacterium]